MLTNSFSRSIMLAQTSTRRRKMFWKDGRSSKKLWLKREHSLGNPKLSNSSPEMLMKLKPGCLRNFNLPKKRTTKIQQTFNQNIRNTRHLRLSWLLMLTGSSLYLLWVKTSLTGRNAVGAKKLFRIDLSLLLSNGSCSHRRQVRSQWSWRKQTDREPLLLLWRILISGLVRLRASWPQMRLAKIWHQSRILWRSTSLLKLT